MRYSRQREAVAEVVKNTTCHPSAEWVHGEIKKSLPSISLGTVYRNLKSLAERGDVLTLETEQGVVHYDGDISAHAHFICDGCGKIYDIFSESGLGAQLEQDGFIVTTEKVIFYGKCKACAAEKLGITS